MLQPFFLSIFIYKRAEVQRAKPKHTKQGSKTQP